MKFSVYAVRDNLIGFGIPLIRDNDAVASRAFEYDINNTDAFTTHPQDFQLYKIGSYDTDTGIIESDTPIVIASAIDFIKEK